MTPEEFQQHLARAKERAASVIDARKVIQDTGRAIQTSFALPEPRPFSSRREIERGMTEFIAQQQAIPRQRLPAPVAPAILTETRTLPTQPIPIPERAEPAHPPVQTVTGGTGLPAGSALGDTLFWNGTAWTLLSIGASGDVYRTSAGGIPEWDTPAPCDEEEPPP